MNKQPHPEAADGPVTSPIQSGRASNTAETNMTKVIRKSVSIDEALDEAISFHQQGNLGQAEAIYQAILKKKPDHFDALHLLGVIRLQQKRFDDALALINRALIVEPESAEAHNNLGNLFAALQKHDKAISIYERSLQINPELAKAQLNLGIALNELRRTKDALDACRRAVEMAPENPEAHLSLGVALGNTKNYEAALECFRHASKLQPDYTKYIGRMVEAQRHVCDWTGIADMEKKIIALVREGAYVTSAFRVIALSDSPKDHLQCAQIHFREKIGTDYTLLRKKEVRQMDKIRVAYLSSDLHRHATAYLTAEMFERHDRENFETFAFSYGPDDGSPIRKRLERGFDHFFHVRDLSDLEIAQKIADLDIHVAVDLKGYTRHCRTKILAHRPAPVQVNYLGFPGTMGVNFIDYIIVDPFIVPLDQQLYFSEKLVQLPDCYQANDTKREVSAYTPTRAECGLPETGFVFCSFNSNYKITAQFFDIWMRLLAAVPGSVLWMLRGSDAVERNLRLEAAARDVDPDRLVFAPSLPVQDHLARLRVADLFLDSLPVNAHTTASDALWVGLPVLTCAGRTFAGRVAGSLLRAIGLPEMVTESLEAYEALALSLAKNPEILRQVRQKLAANRTTTPLFDTDRFCRNLEAAYREMWRIYQRGEAPRPISIQKKS